MKLLPILLCLSLASCETAKKYFQNTKRSYTVFVEDGSGRRAGASATFESTKPQK